MIIEAHTEEGRKTAIHNADGSVSDLLIKSYNTETKEAVIYETNEDGKVKMSDWVTVGDRMTRYPILKTVKLEGSYAVDRTTGKEL